MHRNIVVIEDKPSQLRLAESVLNYKFLYRNVGQGSIEHIGNTLSGLLNPDVLLMDLSNMEHVYARLIREIKAQKPQWPIISLIQYGHDELAMQTIAAGASDFITKPVSIYRLNLTIQNVLKTQNMSEAIARLERVSSGQVNFSDIIGQSEVMQQVIAQAKAIAGSEMPVWIEGEQGTGKEIFARAIHGYKSTVATPFVIIECAKFTDKTTDTAAAGKQKILETMQFFIRKMHDANDGTLYLKDINLLPVLLQESLLELLETRMIPSIDKSGAKGLKCRIIIGCNKTIESANEEPHTPLQNKLYGMVISLPALRDRLEDIPALARYFVMHHSASENKSITDIADDAMALLESHSWPGNVIQLSRMLQRAVLLCHHNCLDAGTLRLIQQLEPVNYLNQTQNVIGLAPTLVDIRGHIKKLKSIEEEAIRFALAHSGGSMTRAARNLGIGRSTLYRKIGAMPPDSYMLRENQTTRPMMEISATERS